ncbi:hypothetical protein EYF80_034346 [Liparis tanakae]|uniref:Uncharacterized protein n=1 Tax=Liparis tanakae TaxID=230148 RepID=A0A4Z2GS14_9TELE|nr:hypothetical protein EYF80_034346 [Liparis tanakae]
MSVEVNMSMFSITAAVLLTAGDATHLTAAWWSKRSTRVISHGCNEQRGPAMAIASCSTYR